MPASVVVLTTVGDIRRRDSELGGDLKERRLGAWETELALEEGGLGGVPVRVSQVQALHGINQLLGSRLGLLDEAGDVEHDGRGPVHSSPSSTIWGEGLIHSGRAS